MTDYRAMYERDFLGSWDVADGDVTVQIKKVVAGSLTAAGGRKTKKPIVFMNHTDKGLALNATNGKTIAALYGPHVEKWTGKCITLYKSVTRAPDGSGDVDCIRIRPTVPTDKPVARKDDI